MQKLRLTHMIAAAALLGALPLSAQQNQQKRAASTGGISPHETISMVIGERRTGNRITITYGRPYTKDPKTGEPRKIWGGLVPWGKADRLGADEATLLTTEQAIIIGGKEIPAGTWSVFTLPVESGASKLILNKRTGQWGIPYIEKNEATNELARIDLKKDTLDKPVDQFTIVIEPAPAGGGMLKLMWENTQFSVPFTVKK